MVEPDGIEPTTSAVRLPSEHIYALLTQPRKALHISYLSLAISQEKPYPVLLCSAPRLRSSADPVLTRLETGGAFETHENIVDRIKPASSRRIVWDETLAGFGVVIQPSGVKSYCFNYRNPEGKCRRVMIGHHGDLTTGQARKIAEGHRHEALSGGDPLGRKQDKRAAPTIDDILDRYLASEEFADKAAVTKAIDRGRIERHIRPTLGPVFSECG